MNLLWNFDNYIVNLNYNWELCCDIWIKQRIKCDAVVYLSLFNEIYSKFIFKYLFIFEVCQRTVIIDFTWKLYNDHVLQNWCNTNQRSFTLFSSYVMTLRIPFLRISGKSIHRGRAAPSNSTLHVNFHRDATYYIIHSP